jgi:hypothetical protein
MTVKLEPDLTITACRISQPFAPPGADVRATVVVENHGLANSAVRTATGESAAGIQAVFVAGDGSERVVAAETVPELAPGARAEVDLLLEMPHDPVRLRVELDPNPIDRVLGNNWRECFFGSPRPRDFLCDLVELPSGAMGVHLMWSNPALYDEVLVYRDSKLISAVPGRCTSFVDQYFDSATGGKKGVRVEYAVRGRIGPSRSVRSTCAVG